MGLSARALCAGYGTAPVLEGVDIEVEEGQVVAVVGPNGSGKTTLVRALSGILKPLSGTVRIGGADVHAITSRERARRIAVVQQSTPLQFAFTVREVVELGRTAYLTGLGSLSSEDRLAVEQAMGQAGVLDLASRDATTVSAGQLQLVAIARALAQKPQVLLLDEPTAHLDVTHQIEVMETVRRLVKADGFACLAVLHDLNLAATYGDRIVMIAKGRLRAQGPPSEVLTRANIASTFGLDVLVRRHPVSGAFFIVPLSVALSASDGAPSRTHPQRVHLVCGGGTGAPLMGELVRRGAKVSVGVVNVLDTDFEVAESLGLRAVAEAPFSQITAAALEEAKPLALHADAVVLTAVPFGRSNLANLGLVEEALAAGKPVFVIDPEGAGARDFTGGEAHGRIQALLAASPGARAAASDDDALRAILALAPVPPPQA
jgi:iron complex transport system ATP-binding protein